MKGCAARLRTGSVDGVNGAGRFGETARNLLLALLQLSATNQPIQTHPAWFDSRHLHPADPLGDHHLRGDQFVNIASQVSGARTRGTAGG